ncbi:hypothetical protein RFI_00533, partial [Reticulomyxa filosa]
MSVGKIFQVCPVQKSNPLITFTVDLRNGFFLTGLASGTVDAWLVPAELGGTTNLKETSHVVDGGNNLSQEEKYSTYLCRRLIDGDNESIRHIYVQYYDDSNKSQSQESKSRSSGSKPDKPSLLNCSIISVVGDSHFRVWRGYSSDQSYTIPYNDYNHTSHACADARIVCYRNHVLLFPQQPNKGQKSRFHYIDLESLGAQGLEQ